MSLTRPSNFMLPTGSSSAVPVCSTRAVLAALPTNVVDRPAFLNEGSRRGFFYLDTYANWSGVVAIDAVQGLAVRSTFDAAYVWVRVDKEITPQMFGAAADYGVTNTNDYAAIVNWFTVLRNVYVKSKGITGLLSGRYYVAQTLVLAFDTASGAKGGTIRGKVKNSDGFYFASGYYCHFRTNDTVFYETLKDFVISTYFDGAGFIVADGAFTGAWNSCDIDLIIYNGYPSVGQIACQINYLLQSKVRLVANCGGTGSGGAGYGTALHLRQAQFNDFSLALGTCRQALLMNDGYVYGNTFDGSLDIEEVNYAFVINGGNVNNNTFIGGTVVARTMFEATAGGNNLFINQNYSLYSGGVTGANKVGILKATTVAWI